MPIIILMKCATSQIKQCCDFVQGDSGLTGITAGDDLLLLLLLLLLYVCLLSQAFLPGTSLEPAVIPTAQVSSFTLQYFPYYV